MAVVIAVLVAVIVLGYMKYKRPKLILKVLWWCVFCACVRVCVRRTDRSSAVGAQLPTSGVA
jgi:hypothetical protein